MKLILFLILSQSSFAKPLCESTPPQSKSFSDQVVQLAQLANVKKRDSRAYTKEVSCMLSMKFAFHAGSYIQGVNTLEDIGGLYYPKYDLKTSRGPGILNLSRRGAEYVTRDHANKDGISVGEVFVIARPHAVYNSENSFGYQDGFEVRVFDEDVVSSRLSVHKPAYKIENIEEEKELYKQSILSAFKKKDEDASLIEVDPERAEKAYCDCLEVEMEDIKEKVRESAKKEKIPLSCERGMV